MHEALYYEKLDSKRVRCHLCPNECLIADGGRGSCGVRRNKLGVLYAEAYGRTTGVALDPIEKKPLYRYHPGEQILSLGTKGCNLHCDFCQNWHISQQYDAPTQEISSEDVVGRAKALGSFGIAYTYNEPFIWYEFVRDTAKIARQAGLENVLVTNGYVNMEPLEGILPLVDAMNIDLKGFDENFYSKICRGRLGPVLDVIKRSAKACHVELTTLLIPTMNDSEEMIRKEVDWICDNCGPDTPLHFSRYFPCYKMSLPPTPAASIERAVRVAREKMKHVYAGNI
jgi:pyruvate formate lyase activating enzyme